MVKYLRKQCLLCAIIPAILAICFALPGCGGGGGGPSSSSGGTGSVQLQLADAIEPGVTKLEVTIARIDAHVVNVANENDTNDANWQTIVTGPKTVDLIQLASNSTLLGPAVNLPAGHYTQIRLILSSATITDASGTYALNVPSGTQTGIKIHGGFDIAPNQVTVILLDFNVKGSLNKLGNGRYQLKPVPDIKAVVQVLSGAVKGTVVNDATGQPVDGATVKATYTAGSSYPVGTEVNQTGTLADGTFTLWALMPGTYTITATASTGNPALTATVADVVVSANQTTTVGTLRVK
jgi:hypothetical protein